MLVRFKTVKDALELYRILRTRPEVVAYVSTDRNTRALRMTVCRSIGTLSPIMYVECNAVIRNNEVFETPERFLQSLGEQ